MSDCTDVGDVAAIGRSPCSAAGKGEQAPPSTLRRYPCMSSSSMPLVSFTMLFTKINESNAKAVYIA